MKRFLIPSRCPSTHSCIGNRVFRIIDQMSDKLLLIDRPIDLLIYSIPSILLRWNGVPGSIQLIVDY